MNKHLWLKACDRVKELTLNVCVLCLFVGFPPQCRLYRFLYILKCSFIKTWTNIMPTKKIKSQNFAESNVQCKTNAHGNFDTFLF